jgi:CDP-diacylglycerol--serine O-phosphatidyltransferase
VLIAFLLVSRLPVWSGKSEGSRVRRDLVLPMMLGVVLYVALLMSYTWEVMVVTVVAYLLSLPFGARKWRRKYGTLTIEEPGVGEDDMGRHI